MAVPVLHEPADAAFHCRAGALQAGGSPNQMFQLENQSQHIAYIIAEADRRSGPKPIVEPTAEAEEEWAQEILKTALYALVDHIVKNNL